MGTRNLGVSVQRPPRKAWRLLLRILADVRDPMIQALFREGTAGA